MSPTRRRLLTALTATGAVTTAGCLGRTNTPSRTSDDEDGSDAGTDGIQVDLGVPCSETSGTVDLSGGRSPTEIDGAQATPSETYADGEIPLREEPLYLGHDRETFAEGDMSGGVSHDGIPSVDEPRFAAADDVQLPPCERVFGV